MEEEMVQGQEGQKKKDDGIRRTDIHGNIKGRRREEGKELKNEN